MNDDHPVIGSELRLAEGGMKDLEVDRVEVFTVGPPTRRLAWALDMPGQYMTGTVVRITTRGGLVGVAGAANYSDFQYESSVAETLRCMVPALIGRSPLQRELSGKACYRRRCRARRRRSHCWTWRYGT